MCSLQPELYHFPVCVMSDKVTHPLSLSFPPSTKWDGMIHFLETQERADEISHKCDAQDTVGSQEQVSSGPASALPRILPHPQSQSTQRFLHHHCPSKPIWSLMGLALLFTGSSWVLVTFCDMSCQCPAIQARILHIVGLHHSPI